MKQVHKLVGAYLQFKDNLIDAADQQVIEEVTDDADDKTSNGGDHGGINT